MKALEDIKKRGRQKHEFEMQKRAEEQKSIVPLMKEVRSNSNQSSDKTERLSFTSNEKGIPAVQHP